MDKKQIKIIPRKTINQYIERINQKTPVDKAIVFGSYARGDTRRDSDLDLIVLSKAFKRMNFLRRLEYLSRNWEDYDLASDIFGYTPEEFAEMSKHSVVLKEAARDGVVVWP